MEDTTKISLERVDQARAWMCYAAFSGDVEKAALAAKVPAAAVRALEHDFGWTAKLKRLKTGAGESDAERVANRAVNYIQAQRVRDMLDRALRLLESEEELVRALVKFRFTREGDVEKVETNPKAVLDLAKAIESAQNMSYRALGDRVAASAQNVDGSQAAPEKSASMANVRGVLDALADMQDRAARTAIPVSSDAAACSDVPATACSAGADTGASSEAVDTSEDNDAAR